VKVVGLLLAAGSGSRMGLAKALVRDDTGTPWVVRQSRVLRNGGCSHVTVVLGAEYAAAAAVLADEPVDTVRNDDWAQGMGSSLRLGLSRLTLADGSTSGPADAEAALVALVDTPGMTADVVRRLIGLAGPEALARAAYHGTPGHPVLIGRLHWGAAAASVEGDHGARAYLREHEASLVECADLASGDDVDEPGQLPPGATLT
jgi:CTP:molybdopterin cytidylyltransferase MocA